MDEANGFDLPDIYGSGYAWDISQLTATGSLNLTYIIPELSRFLLPILSLGSLIIRRRR
jgi:hypothetical protein